MQVLRAITTALDILFLLMFLFFMRGLSWHKENDKYSLVGFGFMIVVYALNIVYMWR